MRFSVLIIFLLCGFLLFSGCTDHEQTLMTLVGNWKYTDGQGKIMEEDWNMISKNQLEGVGVWSQDGDTLFKEKLFIHETDSGWYYTAHPRMAEHPTYFEIVQCSHDGFEAINLHHDYPQEIKYKWNGDSLHIRIKGHPNFEAELAEEYTLLRTH